jgi:hypothetical protein
MKCAVVNREGRVVNVIMASPNDQPPAKCTLVEIPEDSPVTTRWIMFEGELIEGPEIAAKREAEAEAAIMEGLRLDD